MLDVPAPDTPPDPKPPDPRRSDPDPSTTAFDVEDFITRLDGMGMMLSAVALADGRYRVNRWRTLAAAAHAGDIDALWQGQISNDQERLDMLAARLANPPPDTAAAPVRQPPAQAEPADAGRVAPPRPGRRRSSRHKKRRATGGPPLSS